MALAVCPDCGEKVSTNAPTCPHCGRVKNRTSSAGIGCAVLLGLIAIGIFSSVSSDEKPGLAKEVGRSVRVYSCDNAAVAGNAPCFLPDDPKYMTIALFFEPANYRLPPARIPDPGNGFAAKIIGQKEKLGSTWYEVAIRGRSAWVGSWNARLQE